MSGASGDRTTAAERRSLAEWTTLGLSALIVSLVVGLVIYYQVAGGDAPPVLVATPDLGSVRQVGDAYHLPVAVENSGDQPAEDVVVEVTLAPPGGEPETAELTFRFVAGGETVRGIAVFASDPATGELSAGIVSYLAP